MSDKHCSGIQIQIKNYCLDYSNGKINGVVILCVIISISSLFVYNEVICQLLYSVNDVSLKEEMKVPLECRRDLSLPDHTIIAFM